MNKLYKYMKLSTPVRYITVIILFLTGMAVQYLTGIYILGIPFFILSWPFLMLNPLHNVPDDQGFEEWKPVTAKEINHLYHNLNESEKLKIQYGTKWIYASGLIIISVFTIYMMSSNSIGNIGYIILNTVFMLVPAAFFGNAKFFIPRVLKMKANPYYTLLSKSLPENTVFTPYLRFDKNPKGKPIPEDIRFMLELKRKPDDFMGVQFQTAINNGPNGSVPYMYAVILTHGTDGQSYKIAKSKKWLGDYASQFIVEAGGDKEYGTVVIRQRTGSGGYLTDPGDIENLLNAVLQYTSLLT